METEGLEGSPAHAEGELQLATGIYIEELMYILDMDLIDWVGEVIPSVPESPASPLVLPSSCAPVFPPSHLLS